MRSPRPPPARFLSRVAGYAPPPTVVDRQPAGVQKRLDWREHGVITPVRDQRDCYNCVSFAIAALIECRYKRETGADVELAASWMHQCVAQAD